jgi:hypothetical protein
MSFGNRLLHAIHQDVTSRPLQGGVTGQSAPKSTTDPGQHSQSIYAQPSNGTISLQASSSAGVFTYAPQSSVLSGEDFSAFLQYAQGHPAISGTMPATLPQGHRLVLTAHGYPAHKGRSAVLQGCSCSRVPIKCSPHFWVPTSTWRAPRAHLRLRSAWPAAPCCSRYSPRPYRAIRRGRMLPNWACALHCARVALRKGFHCWAHGACCHNHVYTSV